jgi:hypothetical protein
MTQTKSSPRNFASPLVINPEFLAREFGKFFWMNYAGENLQTIDDARAGPREVRLRINNVDSAILGGW